MTGQGFDAFALCSETQDDGAKQLREREDRERAAAELARRQTGFDFFSSQPLPAHEHR